MFFLHRHFFTHTHTRARFNRDVFKRTRFYTEIVVHRNTFTQRCFHTEMVSHTETLLHRDDLTLSSFTHADTITNRGASTNEWIYTRSFYIRMFLHRRTFAWFPTADVKPQFHVLAIEVGLYRLFQNCVKLDPILKTLSAALSRAASSLDRAESNFKAQSKRTEYIELASFDYIGLRVD